jgi:hypothetical protein
MNMDIAPRMTGPQDIIAEDAKVRHAFTKKGHDQWLRSLQRVAKAQAMLWAETPLTVRLAILARVDKNEEDKK